MPKTIKTVAIIGSGFMGTQIAGLAALSGCHIRVYDVKKDALEKAKGEIKLFIEIIKIFNMINYFFE